MTRTMAATFMGIHATLTACVAWFLVGPASNIDAHEAVTFYIIVALYWITLVLAVTYAVRKPVR